MKGTTQLLLGVMGLVALVTGLAATTVATAQEKEAAPLKPIRVLFVGNSQVYYNQLPKIVEALAESAPKERPRIVADSRPSDRSVAGGASLESHWKRGTDKNTARSKIAEEQWDYVILQDFTSYTSNESFTKHAQLFDELSRKNGAQTVLLSTASFPTMVPKGFLDVHERHAVFAREFKVPIAAGGKAWLKYWGENPTQEQILSLYDADKGHPGPKGSYLYACTIYAILTGQSPVGLTHIIPNQPENTITPAEAKQFQEAAWQVHQEVNGKQPANKP